MYYFLLPVGSNYASKSIGPGIVYIASVKSAPAGWCGTPYLEPYPFAIGSGAVC